MKTKIYANSKQFGTLRDAKKYASNNEIDAIGINHNGVYVPIYIFNQMSETLDKVTTIKKQVELINKIQAKFPV